MSFSKCHICSSDLEQENYNSDIFYFCKNSFLPVIKYSNDLENKIQLYVELAHNTSDYYEFDFDNFTYANSKNGYVRFDFSMYFTKFPDHSDLKRFFDLMVFK